MVREEEKQREGMKRGRKPNEGMKRREGWRGEEERGMERERRGRKE